MKQIAVLLVLAILVVFAIPVANLVSGNPSGTAVTRNAAGDARIRQVAEVLEAKCANCHTKETKLPFYATLPVARAMVMRDTQVGLREFDLVAEAFPFGKGAAAETALAKIE